MAADLLNNDRAMGQQAGGLVSLLAAFPILVTLIVMTCGCFDVGIVRFKLDGKSANKVWIQSWAPKWLPSRIYASLPVTAHYTSCLLGLISCFLDAYKKLAPFQPDQKADCDRLCRMFVLFYALSKTCTYYFLGMRARLVYKGQETSTQKFVKWTIYLTPQIFLVLGIVASAHAYGSFDSDFRCVISIDQKWITQSFPAVDFVLAIMFLAFFLVPLKMVANAQSPLISKSSSVGTITAPNAPNSFHQLIKETTRLATAQILGSGISIGMLAWGAAEGGAFGLFTGSFTSFDLLVNCLMQLYSTRKAWEIEGFAGFSSNHGDSNVSSDEKDARNKLMNSSGVANKPRKDTANSSALKSGEFMFVSDTARQSKDDHELYQAKQQQPETEGRQYRSREESIDEDDDALQNKKLPANLQESLLKE